MHDYLWNFPVVRVGKSDRQSDALGRVLYFFFWHSSVLVLNDLKGSSAFLISCICFFK